MNSASKLEGVIAPSRDKTPTGEHQCTNFNWDAFLALSLKTSPDFGPEPHSVTFANIVFHVYQNLIINLQ